MTSLQKWLRTIVWLRREFPAQHKVQVRSRQLKDYHGDASFVKEYFYIQINCRKSFSARIDTLLHEWAHALTWFGNDGDAHGSEWGLMYAQLYRNWLTWNYGQGPENED